MSAIPPYQIVEPGADAPATPLVFASPHSGRVYPAEMLQASALDEQAIRRSEDAFVDQLIEAAALHGATLITAQYARAYVDVNREPYELDPAMFADELPDYARGRTARVAAGLGSIAKIVSEGQEIYARKLTFEEASARIEAAHKPYHAALSALLDKTKDAHGIAVLIDWHSMPSAAAAQGRSGKGCDMVLGDRFGASCSAALTRLVEQQFEAMGYRTVRNAPYAGGYTTEHYGKPQKRVHALQVEINRALYLDEKTMRPTEGLKRLSRDIERLTEALAAADWGRLR
ncbi:MAG: N-formylglutamate amidohydrolase [Parcubacteria group bacterium]